MLNMAMVTVKLDGQDQIKGGVTKVVEGAGANGGGVDVATH